MLTLTAKLFYWRLTNMKKIIILLSCLFASACNMTVSVPLSSIKDTIPSGSILHLTQTIVIPANRSYMYIANGEVKKLKNYNTVDIYQPYCTIHLHKEHTQTRIINPDYFKITKIEEWVRDFGSIFNSNNRFVKHVKTRFFKTIMRNNQGPSIVMHATILTLHSSKQPNVKELVCGHWNDPHEIEPLTLKEMQSALGKLIIINATKAKKI